MALNYKAAGRGRGWRRAINWTDWKCRGIVPERIIKPVTVLRFRCLHEQNATDGQARAQTIIYTLDESHARSFADPPFPPTLLRERASKSRRLASRESRLRSESILIAYDRSRQSLASLDAKSFGIARPADERQAAETSSRPIKLVGRS